jgi:hypothetical protein
MHFPKSELSAASCLFAPSAKKYETIKAIGTRLNYILPGIQKQSSAMVSAQPARSNSILKFSMIYAASQRIDDLCCIGNCDLLLKLLPCRLEIGEKAVSVESSIIELNRRIPTSRRTGAQYMIDPISLGARDRLGIRYRIPANSSDSFRPNFFQLGQG